MTKARDGKRIPERGCVQIWVGITLRRACQRRTLPESTTIHATIRSRRRTVYWNNLEIDRKVYPAHCPDCGAAKWQDKDWETGLVYCLHCGWYAEDEGDERRRIS